MSVTSSTITVSTTAQRIGSSAARRSFLSVHPPASGTVYIGGSTVTTTSGIPLAAGDTPFQVGRSFKDDEMAAEEFWIVTNTGTRDVAVTEITK